MVCKCRCKKEMELVVVWDDGTRAYNLYACHACGRMCKESAWHNPGMLWLNLGNLETDNWVHHFDEAKK